MLYTIMPPELIIKRFALKKKKSLEIMNINGVILEGERTGDYFKIHRVISSDPNAYLNTNISPGSVLKK